MLPNGGAGVEDPEAALVPNPKLVLLVEAGAPKPPGCGCPNGGALGIEGVAPKVAGDGAGDCPNANDWDPVEGFGALEPNENGGPPLDGAPNEGAAPVGAPNVVDVADGAPNELADAPTLVPPKDGAGADTDEEAAPNAKPCPPLPPVAACAGAVDAPNANGA